MVESLVLPLVHLHSAESHEHALRADHDHAAVLHLHAVHSLLHGHRSDRTEIDVSDADQSETYLNLFQAKTISTPILPFLVSQRVQLEEFVIAEFICAARESAIMIRRLSRSLEEEPRPLSRGISRAQELTEQAALSQFAASPSVR